MKKIAIVLIVLLFIAGIVAGVAGYRLNQTYGWLPAGVVSHDTVATPATRLRIALDTIRLGNDLQPYLPSDMPMPRWLPWKLGDLLPKVLPREIAILGGSDFRSGTFGLTVFVNEQRGGPFLPTYLNDQPGFKTSVPGLKWDEPGFSMAGRGVVKATGHLDLPLDLEAFIMQKWSLDPPEDVLRLNGGHLAEGVLDNRNGDIVTLIAALAPLWGSSLDILRQNPQFEGALALLAQVNDIRMAVDFKNPDVLLFQLRINADPEVGGQLEFMGPFALSMLATSVKQQYGLVMESTYAWHPEEHLYQIDVSLTGVELQLKDYFGRMVPSAPGGAVPSQAPKAAR